MANLEWVLAQQWANGWFSNADNTEKHNERPITHTIAYTVDGLIECAAHVRHELMMDRATRTLMSGINLERLVRGEPTERIDNVEALIRREADRWLIRDGQREASKASAHEPAGNATDKRASDGLDASDSSEGEFAEHEPVAEPTDATG